MKAFRALKDDISNCNFVYGYLVKDEEGNPYITEYTSDKGYSHHSCIKGTEGKFTGLYDCNVNEIFEGDTLIDLDVELEEGVKLEDTQQQVYWCEKDGAWKLDDTFSQNKSSGSLLAKDLRDFKFKILGNIYQNKSLKDLKCIEK